MDIAMNELLPSTGYIRLPVVLKLFPISKSTWWAGVKSGRFPAGHKLSERVTAWRVEDIRKMLKQLGGKA
jgi:prophage regulatory protein